MLFITDITYVRVLKGSKAYNTENLLKRKS